MTRRALSYTQRAVLLSVRAALRGGRVDLADQPDGSALATSTAPDGAVLLRAVLRLPVRGADPRQPALPGVSADPAPAPAPPAPVAMVAQRSEAPPPADDTDDSVEVNGLRVGARIVLDGEPVEVLGLDDEAFTWRTVATDARGRPDDEGECYWTEVEDRGLGQWRILPVETETPTQQVKRTKAAKPKRPAKAKPARLTAVPGADTIAQSARGSIAIVWQQTAESRWEPVWSAVSPKAAEIDSAWKAACEAHRARQYNRGGRCTRDSLDGAS